MPQRREMPLSVVTLSEAKGAGIGNSGKGADWEVQLDAEASE